MTLSMLPRAQWQNLVHLDAIRVSAGCSCTDVNAGFLAVWFLCPAKKPAAAPFFLPTVAGLNRDPLFDTDQQSAWEQDAAAGVEDVPRSRVKQGLGEAPCVQAGSQSHLQVMCYITLALLCLRSL